MSTIGSTDYISLVNSLYFGSSGAPSVSDKTDLLKEKNQIRLYDTVLPEIRRIRGGREERLVKERLALLKNQSRAANMLLDFQKNRMDLAAKREIAYLKALEDYQKQIMDASTALAKEAASLDAVALKKADRAYNSKAGKADAVATAWKTLEDSLFNETRATVRRAQAPDTLERMLTKYKIVDYRIDKKTGEIILGNKWDSAADSVLRANIQDSVRSANEVTLHRNALKEKIDELRLQFEDLKADPPTTEEGREDALKKAQKIAELQMEFDGVDIDGHQAALSQLESDDKEWQMLIKEREILHERLYGDAKVESLTSARGHAIRDMIESGWAADHGIDVSQLGIARDTDGDGIVDMYIPGPKDSRALLLWGRERTKGDGKYGVFKSGRTGQVVQLSVKPSDEMLRKLVHRNGQYYSVMQDGQAVFKSPEEVRQERLAAEEAGEDPPEYTLSATPPESIVLVGERLKTNASDMIRHREGGLRLHELGFISSRDILGPVISVDKVPLSERLSPGILKEIRTARRSSRQKQALRAGLAGGAAAERVVNGVSYQSYSPDGEARLADIFGPLLAGDRKVAPFSRIDKARELRSLRDLIEEDEAQGRPMNPSVMTSVEDLEQELVGISEGREGLPPLAEDTPEAPGELSDTSMIDPAGAGLVDLDVVTGQPLLPAGQADDIEKQEDPKYFYFAQDKDENIFVVTPDGVYPIISNAIGPSLDPEEARAARSSLSKLKFSGLDEVAYDVSFEVGDDVDGAGIMDRYDAAPKKVEEARKLLQERKDAQLIPEQRTGIGEMPGYVPEVARKRKADQESKLVDSSADVALGQRSYLPRTSLEPDASGFFLDEKNTPAANLGAITYDQYRSSDPDAMRLAEGPSMEEPPAPLRKYKAPPVSETSEMSLSEAVARFNAARSLFGKSKQEDQLKQAYADLQAAASRATPKERKDNPLVGKIKDKQFEEYLQGLGMPDTRVSPVGELSEEDFAPLDDIATPKELGLSTSAKEPEPEEEKEEEHSLVDSFTQWVKSRPARQLGSRLQNKKEEPKSPTDPLTVGTDIVPSAND